MTKMLTKYINTYKWHFLVLTSHWSIPQIVSHRIISTIFSRHPNPQTTKVHPHHPWHVIHYTLTWTLSFHDHPPTWNIIWNPVRPEMKANLHAGNDMQFITYIVCICFQESSQPSTSRRISATERSFCMPKFSVWDGCSDFPVEGVREEDAGEGLSTVIVHCAVLSSLVANQSCTSCKKHTLSIRAVYRTLRLETFCTSCNMVLNSTLSSDQIGETQATNSPFVVMWSVISATMDMGAGYAGLEKFSRYLDMPVMTRNTFLKHQNVISDTSMLVVNDVMCVSALIVRNVYKRLDPSIDKSDVMDLMVSVDGSWLTRHWMCRGDGDRTGDRLHRPVTVLSELCVWRRPVHWEYQKMVCSA